MASDPGFVAQFATQEEAPGKKIGLGGIGCETILRCKCVPRIVVALHVGVTKRQHVVRIDVRALHPDARLLKKWNRLLNAPQRGTSSLRAFRSIRDRSDPDRRLL